MKWPDRALRPTKRPLLQMLRGEDTKAKMNDQEKNRTHISLRNRAHYRWNLTSSHADPQSYAWCILQAKKGCSLMLYKPGQGPPWDFVTALRPPEIDVPYFRAYQLIAKRALACWAFYRNALKHRHAVPRYILDLSADDLLFRDGFGMEEWYPAWFDTIVLAAQPRDYGRLQCFNFEAMQIATNTDRTEPAVGWNALPYPIVLPGSLANNPRHGLQAPGQIPGPMHVDPEDYVDNEEVDTAFLNILRQRITSVPAAQLQDLLRDVPGPRMLRDVLNCPVTPSIREFRAFGQTPNMFTFELATFGDHRFDYIATSVDWSLPSWCVSMKRDYDTFKTSLLHACVRLLVPWFTRIDLYAPERHVLRALREIQDPDLRRQITETSRLAHVVIKCVLRWLAQDQTHEVDSIVSIADPAPFHGKESLSISIQDGVWSMQTLESAISGIPETFRHEIRSNASLITRCICILGPTFTLGLTSDHTYQACCEVATEANAKIAYAVIRRARGETLSAFMPDEGVQAAQQPAAAPLTADMQRRIPATPGLSSGSAAPAPVTVVHLGSAEAATAGGSTASSPPVISPPPSAPAPQ